MRPVVALLVLALCACGSEREPREQGSPAAPVPAPAATPRPTPASASLMAIPNDPKALKRLEEMGYTIHKEEGHLHAPGLDGCPAMGAGSAM